MTPLRENEMLVCRVGAGKLDSLRISMNQPRSSSNRRSGMTSTPSITC